MVAWGYPRPPVFDGAGVPWVLTGTHQRDTPSRQDDGASERQPICGWCCHGRRLFTCYFHRTKKQRNKETKKQRNKETKKQRKKERQTDRQADRQTDRQTGRQADRQTDRQKNAPTETSPLPQSHAQDLFVNRVRGNPSLRF